MSFDSTGAWQTYRTVVVTKTLNPGYNRITIFNTAGTYNVDKIVVTPVVAADEVTKGTTNLNFKDFDTASDAALIKNGSFVAAKAGDFASVIVKPEIDGVYKVTLDAEASMVINGKTYKSGDEVVLNGETEIFFYADKATTINKITLEYLENVEHMGVWFNDAANVIGGRFANEFAIDKIVINAVDAIKAGKITLSNGKEIAVDAIDANGEKEIAFGEAEKITWLVYNAEGAANADVALYGAKVMDSVTDMAFEGYVSSADGWLPVEESHKVTVATEGKLGFGFDKEVTVEKVVVVGVDNTIPATATLTTSDDKKVEITGTTGNNCVTFELDDVYLHRWIRF